MSNHGSNNVQQSNMQTAQQGTNQPVEQYHQGWIVLHRWHPAHRPLQHTDQVGNVDHEHVGLLLQRRRGWHGRNVMYAETPDVQYFRDGHPIDHVHPNQVNVLIRRFPCKRNLSINLRRCTHMQGFLRCPAELAQDSNATYIKSPPVKALETRRLRNMAVRMLEKEAAMCEVIWQRGGVHPNIATWLGLVVENERATGMALARYRTALNDVEWTSEWGMNLDIDQIFDDIVEGVHHMHRIGFCHNDLKPANVCLNDEGRAVLIDFDSTMPTGEPLWGKAGTRGWSRHGMTLSEERNDEFSLGRIREWLDRKQILVYLSRDEAGLGGGSMADTSLSLADFPDVPDHTPGRVLSTNEATATPGQVVETDEDDVSIGNYVSPPLTSSTEVDDVRRDPDYVNEDSSTDSDETPRRAIRRRSSSKPESSTETTYEDPQDSTYVYTSPSESE